MHTITAQLPDDLAQSLDEIAASEGHSKSWVIREAITEYIAHKQDIEQMTAEGLADLRAGRMISHKEVLKELSEWNKKK